MCVCVFAHHILFIHSPADGHVDGFHVLAVVNSAGMNTGMCVHAFSILLTAPWGRRSCDHRDTESREQDTVAFWCWGEGITAGLARPLTPFRCCKSKSRGNCQFVNGHCALNSSFLGNQGVGVLPDHHRPWERRPECGCCGQRRVTPASQS